MSTKKQSFKYVGTVPYSLASGRPLAPGDYFELTEDEINDEHNADLIQRNLIIEGKPSKATDKSTEEGS